MRNSVTDQVMDRIYTLRSQIAKSKERGKVTPLTLEKIHLLAMILADKSKDKGREDFYQEAKDYAYDGLRICKTITDEYRKHKHLSDEDFFIVVNTKRRCHAFLGRTEFHHFLIAVEWHREIEKKFYPPRAKVFRSIVQDIQDLWDRKLKLVAISLPAGVGKSTIGIFAMAWIIGMDWEEPNLMTGYGSQLTSSFYMGIRSIIDDPEYSYCTIFPEINMVRSDAKDGVLDYRGDGKRFARRIPTLQTISIEGAVTGRGRCRNLLYSDDLVNGIEEGLNRDRLDSKWMKYANDFRSRAKTGYIELIIGTRWSIHDPIGRLEALYEDDPKYKFISIPALDDNGESNFDFKYGVGFTTEYYEDIKDVMDDISFSCQYQQEPVERDGLSFPESELKRYFTLPQDPPDEIMAACDVAFGGGDFLSFPVVAWWGDDPYLIDVIFDKNHYKITEPRVLAAITRNGVQRAEFEANNGGEFYANDINDMMKQETHRCNITSKRASNTKGKVTRIIQYKPDIREIYFPDKSMYKSNDDMGKFMRNLTTFVETGKNRNDDAPDSMAQLMAMVRKKSRAAIVIGNRKGLGI